MKKIIGIALSLAVVGLAAGCSSVTSSNHVIYGVVADVESNPVPGAIVTSTPPTSSVSTDKEGRYMIKAVKEGEYTVRANKMGYVPNPAKIHARGTDFVQADIQLIPEEMIPATQVYVEPAPAAEAVTTVAPVTTEAAAGSEVPAATEEKSNKAWWEKK